MMGPVAILAPLCRDEIAVGGSSPSMRAGGAALYASWALSKLGARVVIHTPLAERDRDLLECLPGEVEVVVHPSRETTFFRIEIEDGDPDRRTLRLLRIFRNEEIYADDALLS
jgi:hypothetical protein